MHIGLMLEGQNGLNWARWQRILQIAEDAGYQSVFRSDHFTNTQPPDIDSLELWVSLTYAASHTQRIEFGSMVAPVTFRHPSMTARMAVQVDNLSGGRLVLGLGAGWQEREHRTFGIPFYDWGTRYAMLEDALEMTTLLFSSDEPVSYNGQHFSLDEAILLPRPQRAGGPPILIGGGGPKRTLPLAARYAREWNVPFTPIDSFQEKSALLTELLEKEGRDPAEVQRSVFSQAQFGKNDADLQAKLNKLGKTTDELWAERGITAGTTAEFLDRVGRWQEAGVERLLLQWLDLDDIEGLEIIARDILPHFHTS
jgi:F420-dependent oxidoreductase-like protein